MVGSVIGFATTISAIAAMVTSLLFGYSLNESGIDGYISPFVIASFGIFIVHRLSPLMTPLFIN